VHPHHHGHSADQVFGGLGGLGGALVVRCDLVRIPAKFIEFQRAIRLNG
jgi:hypothetical protein